MLEDEPRLSPLYDLVPLGAYPQYSQLLTMPIGSRRHTGNITLKDWNALAVDCDLEILASTCCPSPRATTGWCPS